METISELLKEIHRARINELNDPAYSQVDLAQWFGIDQALFNHYYLGRRQPGEENIKKLAAKAGPVVYDIMKLARPDPHLDEIRTQYDRIPEDQAGRYVREIIELTEDFLREHGYKRIK